jgi:hypothetical protein
MSKEHDDFNSGWLDKISDIKLRDFLNETTEEVLRKGGTALEEARILGTAIDAGVEEVVDNIGIRDLNDVRKIFDPTLDQVFSEAIASQEFVLRQEDSFQRASIEEGPNTAARIVKGRPISSEPNP